MVKKNQKNNILVYILIVVMLISTLGIGINIVGILTGNQINIEIANKNYLKNKYYQMSDDATEYQKEIFKELTTLVEKEEKTEEDDLKMAELVGKSFVADLFTLSNKDGNYEIGGLQYVYGSSLSGFKTYMRDSLYRDLDLYIAQYGYDYLPTVKNIEATAVYNGKFDTYLDSFDSYYVELYWEYEDFIAEEGSESKVVDTADFQKKMYLYIIKTDEGRFEVVQFFDEF